jgi:hypothetical protein
MQPNEDLSHLAQSQEYSFSKPNAAELEGVTARKQEQSRDEPPVEGVPEFPMSAQEFLKHFKHVLLKEEKQELEKGTFDTIHFGGLVPMRKAEDM